MGLLSKPRAKPWIFATAVFGMSFFGGPALACKCMPLASGKTSKPADLVFIGKVSSLTPVYSNGFRVNKADNSMTAPDASETRFNAIEWIHNPKHLKDISVKASAVCNAGFEEGKSYVVYAHEYSPGKFSTGLCSGTRILSNDSKTEALKYKD